MGVKTGIEWADATWNPWRGCTKVSPACDNCYAERGMKRWGQDFGKITIGKTTWDAPLRWKKPRRIFVCSWSDFFHPSVPQGARTDACAVMEAAPRHTYMLLTKRAENIMPMIRASGWGCGLPDNVWIGVTAENQEQADRRIPLLLQVPAKVRFVSCEPLLGPVRLSPVGGIKIAGGHWGVKAMRKDGGGLSWVICGGESGPNARPMRPGWARALRDQCAAAGVPFFFKQWGEYSPYYKAVDIERRQIVTKTYKNGVARVGKKAAGCLLDGKEYKEIPR